jgi:DNA polymerase III subunit delta'
MILGQDRAIAEFTAAWAGRRIHHAWLLAGPKGVGKASFARAAMTRVAAEAAGPAFSAPPLVTPAEHRIAQLIAAGSHPDMRWVERLEKEDGKGLARSITVDQVRELREFMALAPALSPWRVVAFDSADDLERNAANALLKMLEEPPPCTLFLLVSHSPGRLLPTSRSRCRRLNFADLGPGTIAEILRQQLGDGEGGKDRTEVIAAARGSAGRALALARHDLLTLQEQVRLLLREGDSGNALRSRLANELGRKGAAERYAAFLDMLPALVAEEAVRRDGPARARALDAYEQTRALVRVAPRHSLDPAATLFQLGGILASAAPAPLP